MNQVIQLALDNPDVAILTVLIVVALLGVLIDMLKRSAVMRIRRANFDGREGARLHQRVRGTRSTDFTFLDH